MLPVLLIAAAIVGGAALGALVAIRLVGPNFDPPIDDFLGPLIAQFMFWLAIGVAVAVVIIELTLAWRRGRFAWLAFGAASFVAAALVTASALPPDAGQGPVVAINTGSHPVLVTLDTFAGSWLLGPGEQVTLVDDRPADSRGAFLFGPESCEEVGLAVIRLGGPIRIVIGEGPLVTGIYALTSAADAAETAVAPALNGCPNV
jgi:hypothetical protein